MTLRFTPRARDDLREIMDYIAKENPVGADRVGRAIFDACALVAARPYLGIRNSGNSQRKSPGIAEPPDRAISIPDPLFRRERQCLDRSHPTFRAATPG